MTKDINTLIVTLLVVTGLGFIGFNLAVSEPNTENSIRGISPVSESDIGYFTLEDSDSETQKIPVYKPTKINSDDLHFTTTDLTYQIYNCDAEDTRSVQKVFNEIERVAPMLSFTWGEVEYNIWGEEKQSHFNVTCFNGPSPEHESYGGIGGPAFYPSTLEITNADIEIYKVDDEKYYTCDEISSTVLHEVLHGFGFDHQDEGILTTYDEDCDLFTDDDTEVIEKLKYIYSNGKEGINYDIEMLR